MNTIIRHSLLITLAMLSLQAKAVDQCNFTFECKVEHGDQATDCLNSKSNNSVCMCGANECSSTSVPTPTPTPTPSNSPSPSGSVVTMPGSVQAEDFVRYADTTTGNAGGQYRDTDVDIQTTSDVGGGFNVGWIDGNEWLEFDIDIAEAANYQATVRVASKPGNGMFSLEIDNIQKGPAITVNATGGWQQWQNKTIDLGQLTAGQSNLRLQVQAGGFNVNWIRIDKVDNGSSNPDTAPADMLGEFDRSKDLLLANFDSRPDPDDIHAVAGFATMLRDSRFAKVNYHAVTGAYGTQGGDYIEAVNLFNLSFGQSWSNAHTNWNQALDEVYAKVSATLQAGGDIWIQEAGQSDFSADLIRRIKQQLPAINTNARIHIVQHSNWNQDNTTAADLTYVKQQSDYHKIADGNSVGNGTPGFNNASTSQWSRVLNHPQVGAIWTEAKAIADNSIATNTGWQNPTIRDGGMDFSDVAEDAWIFGFGSLRDINEFFNEFL